MKIVCDMSVLELPPTGVGKAAIGLYEACFRQRKDLEVIAAHRRTLKTSLSPSFLRQQRGRFLPEAWWRKSVLPLMIKRSEARWAHFPWSGHVPILPMEVKVITTLHDVLPLIIPNYFKSPADEMNYRKRIQKDIDRTHILFTDSEFSKKEIMRNFTVRSEPVVLMLASTIETGEVIGQPVNENNTGYFFYVGGYDRRKGLDKLLRVFSRLRTEKKTLAKLIIAGDKKFISDECERHLNVLRSQDAVEELGYISDDELARRLRGAVALVYPSKYEGFGLPPLEAMALGCPVITTRYTSIPEICEDSAFYIDPDDDVVFAQSLVILYTDKNLRMELKEKGLKQAAKFSWSKTAERFLRHIVEYEKRVY
jgi:glycosyltransferase involved in cell wall biosynthesis